ncbi:uncharacterized protein MONOS_2000 [Monocercomonoides exilis]|uniref:uncharacterized protein n=1 Tax=Monocercomonoides exilis TaxID=2049356 RepID=UPI00355A1C0B|nr:hypothetical protein MONOS_2000 [Monocercomonoides exilis]|eukprot:MONOS_2000.1-p1 / transcript=MONOS_2000.1 / gene=MONOS_2000 / organism=Monocercomonoides_exilis_PA203 / gene_product=unspecified product / transcript_product=unspecified product / location=Mono_scaffold00038:149397-150455(-) / protein_length=251 / sequence_SO=supercontig / SO=protein_coding / is_pseudo=false
MNEKLSQLMNYSGAELKHKIEEMNILVDEMNNEEIKDIFNKELSLLCGRFEKMIEEEEKKEEEKDETLLVNLCECYLSLHHYSSEIGEIISIIVPCLLNIALNKKESEEAQNEVEIALLALSCIDMYREMEPKLHLNEIREIIKHHQEHHNLTQLAYQSAWLFLINRLFCNGFLEDIVVNELHFGREAARELEELTKCVNWKKKEEEMSKEEAKEEFSLMRWVETLNIYFGGCQLQNEEFVKILSRIVQL